MNFRTSALLAAVSATSLLAAASAQGALAYGITIQNTLVAFDTATPGTIAFGGAISGLQSNEVVRGIDFRPATGELFVLGSSSRLYRLNANATQNAFPVGGYTATQVGSPFANVLNGSNFGFDFNPTIDRIRVVSNTGQNLVLNPDTGAVQLNATALFYGPGDVNVGQSPTVTNAAYTNNFAGATASQLYVIDTTRDILATQSNNAGVLGTVGPLGINIEEIGGFDIGAGNIAYAAIRDVTRTNSELVTINLTTGQATRVGEIGGGLGITAFAVVPAPSTLPALAIGALAFARRRR